MKSGYWCLDVIRHTGGHSSLNRAGYSGNLEKMRLFAKTIASSAGLVWPCMQRVSQAFRTQKRFKQYQCPDDRAASYNRHNTVKLFQRTTHSLKKISPSSTYNCWRRHTTHKSPTKQQRRLRRFIVVVVSHRTTPNNNIKQRQQEGKETNKTQT